MSKSMKETMPTTARVATARLMQSASVTAASAMMRVVGVTSRIATKTICGISAWDFPRTACEVSGSSDALTSGCKSDRRATGGNSVHAFHRIYWTRPGI